MMIDAITVELKKYCYDALFPDLITHKFGSSVKLKESLLVEGSDTKILKRRVKNQSGNYPFSL